MRRLLISGSLVLPLIAGCQTYPVSYDAPYSIPPVGTIIQLNQALTVLPGTSRSFIQYAKPQVYSAVNQRAPWCQFSLYEPPQALRTERTILPDQFTVVRSYQASDTVTSLPFVFSSSALESNFFNGSGPSSQTLSTVMKLKSEKQPHVVELKCAVFDDPFSYNYVSVSQIQRTLGDIVTLKFNRDGT